MRHHHFRPNHGLFRVVLAGSSVLKENPRRKILPLYMSGLDLRRTGRVTALPVHGTGGSPSAT